MVSFYKSLYTGISWLRPILYESGALMQIAMQRIENKACLALILAVQVPIKGAYQGIPSRD